MPLKLTFVFYLAAVTCFTLDALAAVGPRFARGGRGASRVALTPLGLGLWLFPTMWNAGEAAF